MDSPVRSRSTSNENFAASTTQLLRERSDSIENTKTSQVATSQFLGLSSFLSNARSTVRSLNSLTQSAPVGSRVDMPAEPKSSLSSRAASPLLTTNDFQPFEAVRRFPSPTNTDLMVRIQRLENLVYDVLEGQKSTPTCQESQCHARPKAGSHVRAHTSPPASQGAMPREGSPAALRPGTPVANNPVQGDGSASHEEV